MGKKILIIEDNNIDLLIVKRHLNHFGYDQIITAEDGSSGIKKAIEEKPDLVILDTILPDNNGFEVCRQIREASDGRGNPKIIITTGSVDAVDALQARRVGADDYCAKTSDCAPLLEAIRKLADALNK